MAQLISNLPAGTLVNLIENRSGTKVLTPFLIIATGSGNPYGSDKVFCVRYRYTDSVAWDSSGSALYNGSTVDNWLTNTYLSRFDNATKNCIAVSTIKNINITTSEQYTLARKVFLLSNKEAGGSDSHDPSTAIPYFSSNASRIAYDDTGVTGADWWLRSPYSSQQVVVVESTGNIDTTQYLQGARATRPALNLFASCKVSSEPNSDGSYNLLPSVYAGIGDDNTGVTGADVDPSVFLQMISDIGSYTFTYTNGSWVYDGDTVDIADYGMTVTGTPESGDTVIVTIPQSMQILDASVIIGETDYMPTQCVVDWAEVNNTTTYLQLCNNYNDASPTWENAQKNTVHNFTNTAKTANDWCVGARFYAMSENTIKIFAPHALVRKW